MLIEIRDAGYFLYFSKFAKLLTEIFKKLQNQVPLRYSYIQIEAKSYYMKIHVSYKSNLLHVFKKIILLLDVFFYIFTIFTI